MIKVFVSSRFEEFAELRRELSLGIQGATTMDLVALDDGSAAPVTTAARSMRAVSDADVMVLILGRTYADDDRELSTTHQEFHAALDAGIPIHSYSLDDAPSDTGAAAFLADVREHLTVGQLIGHPARDAERILFEVVEWVNLDADDGAVGVDTIGDALLRELEYLGARDLDSALLNDNAGSQPLMASVVERRRLAIVALRDGWVREARTHLVAATDVDTSDWATTYLCARVLAMRGLRSDIQAALSRARRASQRAEDTQTSPVSNGRRDVIIQRRRAASFTLLAQLHRRTGDVARADDAIMAAEESLDTPSRTVLSEQARIAALKGDEDRVVEAVDQLVRLLPPAAHAVLRAPELREFRDDVEARVATSVRHLRNGARRRFGSRTLSGHSVSLRAEVAGYADDAHQARDTVADALADAASIVMAAEEKLEPLRQTGVTAAALLDRRLAELERRTDEAQLALLRLRRAGVQARTELAQWRERVTALPDVSEPVAEGCEEAAYERISRDLESRLAAVPTPRQVIVGEVAVPPWNKRAALFPAIVIVAGMVGLHDTATASRLLIEGGVTAGLVPPSLEWAPWAAEWGVRLVVVAGALTVLMMRQIAWRRTARKLQSVEATSQADLEEVARRREALHRELITVVGGPLDGRVPSFGVAPIGRVQAAAHAIDSCVMSLERRLQDLASEQSRLKGVATSNHLVARQWEAIRADAAQQLAIALKPAEHIIGTGKTAHGGLLASDADVWRAARAGVAELVATFNRAYYPFWNLTFADEMMLDVDAAGRIERRSTTSLLGEEHTERLVAPNRGGPPQLGVFARNDTEGRALEHLASTVTSSRGVTEHQPEDLVAPLPLSETPQPPEPPRLMDGAQAEVLPTSVTTGQVDVTEGLPEADSHPKYPWILSLAVFVLYGLALGPPSGVRSLAAIAFRFALLAWIIRSGQWVVMSLKRGAQLRRVRSDPIRAASTP